MIRSKSLRLIEQQNSPKMKREILSPIIILYIIMALIFKLAWGQSNELTNGTRLLRIAIPVRNFNDFVAIERSTNGDNNYSGFAIEVFHEAIQSVLPYTNYTFIGFEKSDHTMNGSFDDMLQAVSRKEYDGAVGEITILYSRTQWVDFTMPYLESPISMLVRRNDNAISSRVSLIGITYAFLITAYALSFIAATIYVVSITKCARSFGGNENNAPRDAELGALIHTRLLMTAFFLVVIVLLACYIVSQASSNTPRGSATVANLTQLKEEDANVGYRQGSFISDVLIYKGFSESKLKSLKSEEEMVDMLSKGTLKGGVDAIVANEPHLTLLQAKHCVNFTIVKIPTLHSTGIGFAFWDSMLASNVSEGILKMTDNGRLGKIQDRTIGNLEACLDDHNNDDVASSFLPPRYNWILIVGGSLIGLLTIVSFFFLF